MAFQDAVHGKDISVVESIQVLHDTKREKAITDAVTAALNQIVKGQSPKSMALGINHYSLGKNNQLILRRKESTGSGNTIVIAIVTFKNDQILNSTDISNLIRSISEMPSSHLSANVDHPVMNP